MNLHQILHEAWAFLHRNYSDDSEGRRYGQVLIGSFITTTHPLMHHISCRGFDETSNHPGDSASLQPRFGTLWHLGFSKTKITFERDEISDHWWYLEKYNGAADGDWENWVRPQGAYFGRDWGILSYVQCFLYLLSSSINTYFFYYMTGYLLDRPCMFMYFSSFCVPLNIVANY